MGTNYNPKIVTNGLVLCLDAANRKSYPGSGNTWIDLTGVGNNGTLNGSPTYETTNGGRFLFSGTSQFVTSSFATTAGQAITYMGWLYSTETTTNYRTFVYGDAGIYWNTTGQIEFYSPTLQYTTPSVYRNQWVHLSISKPSGSSAASYYLNGNLANTGTAYTTTAATLRWFTQGGPTPLTWKGYCSNYQVYNRELSAAEVQQNFNAMRGRFGI